MKSSKSIITLLLFSLFLFSNHAVGMNSASTTINHELATLVDEADSFLNQKQTFAFSEIHHDNIWHGDNAFFIAFVALFSITSFIIITSQYGIFESNRRPFRQ